MKKLRKATMFVLSFLLATGIFAQTNVYAKGNAGGSSGKSKVHEKVKKSTDKVDKATNKTVKAEKAVPYGLAKKAVPPVIKQGGVLIPVNAVIKSLGADVAWDAETQLVTITKEGTTIVINLTAKTATVNGVETPLPAELVTEIAPAAPEDAVTGTDTSDATVATDTTITSDATAETDTTITSDATDGTSEVEGISKNGTIVLFNFIAENLGVDLDATTEEQLVDEALTEDAAQTTDATQTTDTTGSTSATETVEQTSAGL